MDQQDPNPNYRYIWILMIIGSFIFMGYSLAMFPQLETMKHFSLAANILAMAASKPDLGWPGKLRIPLLFVFTLLGSATLAALAFTKLLGLFELMALMYICTVSWRGVFEWRQGMVLNRPVKPA